MVDWLLRSYQQANKQKVTNAFLASLSTRRLELRSALGSYALARTFPQHTFLPVGNIHVPVCRLCGEIEDSQAAQDLNVLNFERIKWGGVRHTHPLYAAFDLSRLTGTEVPEPIESDYEIFNQILKVILSCGANDRPNQLEKKLSGVFSSSKDERRIVIDILGICGILEPKGRSSYYRQFVPTEERENVTDWSYPVEWWRGKDGINKEAVHFYFGTYTKVNIPS
jgi:hypothetical protein